jgi:lipoate synthase
VKKPAWLRQRAAQGEKYARMRETLGELKLNTVCVEAQCPNIGEVCTQLTPRAAAHSSRDLIILTTSLYV